MKEKQEMVTKYSAEMLNTWRTLVSKHPPLALPKRAGLYVNEYPLGLYGYENFIVSMCTT